MVATTLITGTVAGFVLVIDPDNEKGKREQFEFQDAADLQAKRTELDREQNAYYRAHPRENYDPIGQIFFTKYRRNDTGAIVEQDGFSIPMNGRPSRKVGDPAYLQKCKCGKTNWSEMPDEKEYQICVTGEYVCEDCNQDDDSFDDFSNYDGSQEREY